MRARVDADPQPLDQLAAQPARDSPNTDPHQRENEGYGAGRMCWVTVAQPPAERKQGNHNDVSDAMPHADSFGASATGNIEPINKAENSREQPADNASCDVPVGR